MIRPISLFSLVRRFFWMLSYPKILSRLISIERERRIWSIQPSFGRDGRGRKIRQVSIRITDICNLRCRTCGQWGENGFLRGEDISMLRKEEVPVNRYIELLSDLILHGHNPLLYIWGGEPMLYKGIIELIDRASYMGFPTSIATNGTHIAENAEFFINVPLFLLQISIDGHTHSLHNRLRPSAKGRGDNFSGIVHALHAIKERKKVLGSRLPIIASLTVISRDNMAHLVDIYNTFKDWVDLFVYYLSWWIDVKTAKRHDEDFKRRFGFLPKLHWGWIGDWLPDDYSVLSKEIDLLLKISNTSSNPPVILIPPITGQGNLELYYTRHSERFGFNRCISIYHAVEINSNGDLSPCRDYHDYVVGNIKKKNITELWNSNSFKVFRKSMAKDGLMPACSRCCGLMGY